MQHKPMISLDLWPRMKIGALTGIMCGIGLYALFFGIDNQIGVPYGTFYKIVGLLFGFEGQNAIMLGIALHLITTTIIGMIFSSASTTHRLLYLSTMKKGLLAGGVTGVEIFALMFMPLTVYAVVPLLEGIVTGQPSSPDFFVAEKILGQMDQILWGSLVVHIMFGITMGFVTTLMLRSEYQKYKSARDKVIKNASSV